MSSPEVNSVLPELPHLGDYFTSLYNCDYARFFRSLAEIEQIYLIPSRILSPHTQYYVREMRILAYSQLLQSYRSVSIASLSAAFGVTPSFIDAYVPGPDWHQKVQTLTNIQRPLPLHHLRPPELHNRQSLRNR